MRPSGRYLKNITDIVTYSLLSAECVLIIIISFLVLRNVSLVFPTCQVLSFLTK